MRAAGEAAAGEGYQIVAEVHDAEFFEKLMISERLVEPS